MIIERVKGELIIVKKGTAVIRRRESGLFLEVKISDETERKLRDRCGEIVELTGDIPKTTQM